MSMEMTFVVTWGGAILVGVLLGLIGGLNFDKDKEE